MQPWKTYLDGDFTFTRTRLDDENYERAMRALVILCADVVLCNPNDRVIYLAERVIHPAKGWWWIGGRLFPGEEFKDAAARKLREETGQTISPERFVYVMQHRLLSGIREQDPQEAGSDTFSILFRLDISPTELRGVHSGLSTKEYRPKSLKPFHRETLDRENTRPQIRDAYRLIYGE